MKHFRLAVVALGTSLTGAGLLLACSSDDTIVGNDAGLDSGTDTGTDTGQTDGGEQDAQPDAFDAGLSFSSFRDQLATAFCQSVARCCFGNANLHQDAGVDGGFYDEATCLDQARKGGLEGSLLYNEDAGTPLILDQSEAITCINKLKAVSCVLGRDEFVAARSACFKAVRGTAAVGQTCTTAIDCVPGLFCNGVSGKCELLRDEDAGCGDFTTDNGAANEACSWRGSGDTNRYCEFFDFVGGDVLPQDQWKCRAARTNGESCVSSLWCGQGLCDDRNDVDPKDNEPDFVCRTPVTYFPPGTDYCNPYVKP